MSIESTLRAGRRKAEQLMTDTVTVRYPTGQTTQDPDTGSTVPVYADRFTSKAGFTTTGTVAMTEEVGGRTAVVIRELMKLPALGPVPSVGDVVEITAVSTLSNPHRVGRKYKVTGDPVGTNETQLRIPVERLAA